MENTLTPLNMQNEEVINKKEKFDFKMLRYIAFTMLALVFLTVGFRIYKEYVRDNAINNIFVENAYSDKADVLDSIRLVKKLPLKITDKIIKNNVKIDYIPWEPADNADGQYRGLDKLVLVKYTDRRNTNIFTKYQNQIVTLHEVAHAFDYDYSINLSGYAYSGIKEFYYIYKEEAKKLLNTEVFENTNIDYLNYYVNDRREFFAQCFALYYVSDETNKILQEKAPKTYNFIKKVTAPTEKYTFINFLEKILKKK